MMKRITLIRKPAKRKLLIIREPPKQPPPPSSSPVQGKRGKLIKLFCWMTDQELRACCKQTGVAYPPKESFTIAERQRIMRGLEAKGWWRADVSVSPPKLQRKPTS